LQYRLAHLSDPHLGPLPLGAALRNFAFKRLIGGASWIAKRRRLHQMQIADGIRADVVAAQADHVAVTGDLVNIAALAEFAPAAQWLAGFGTPQNVSYVPGNHDCYVPIPYNSGLAHFEAFAEGDMKLPQPLLHNGGTMTFPYVRLRRNIAMIGLSSGLPQALHRASGQLGGQQLAQLARLLPELRGKGYCRVVMIHHPPMKMLANDRRGLRDVEALEGILREYGAELVLHGHNHKRSLEYIESAGGPVPVWGAPSASMRPHKHHETAGWTMFHIERIQGNWSIQANERDWDFATGRCVEGRTVEISRT
jgi:3',5'-cyclic AMP phosphodiesterase CpdA